MKKIISLNMAVLLFALMGGCAVKEQRLDTRFIFDTVIKLDIECDDKTLQDAFNLCERYEGLFSRTDKNSELYSINKSSGFVSADDELLELLERGLYFGAVSGGDFDITICPVSELWNFKGTELPDRKEIAEALKNVDYESVEIKNGKINTNGKKLDLGGIAKGFIADKLKEFFEKKGIREGTINLGGNIYVFGKKSTVIGIADPDCPEVELLTVKVKNLSVVTSGIYQRKIEKDGKLYHHILSPKTGYGVESDLASATVIGKSSTDCDALSTICILKGSSEALKLIEKTENTQAILISRDGSIAYTSGLYREENDFFFKN